MNIKKLVSAVSALTIAGSVFAGLAVTANAAVDRVWDFSSLGNKEGVTYSSDTIKLGGIDCNIGTDKFEGLAFQGADKWYGYNGGLYNGNGGGRTFGILNLKAEQTVTISATTTLSLTTGDVASQSGQNGNTYVYTMTKDGDLGVKMDNRYYVINSITIETPDPSEAEQYTVSASETDSATVIVSKMKAEAGETITVTPTAKSGYEAPYTITVVDATGKNVAVNADNTFSMPASNVTVSAKATARTVATKLTVNYVDGQGTSIKSADEIVLSSKYIGDTQTYYVPAYIENGGKLYRATGLGTTKAGSGSTSPYVTDYSFSPTLTKAEEAVTVTYNVVEAMGYQYVDFDDLDSDGGINRMWMYSNGKFKQIDTEEVTTLLTVEEEGYYTVEVNVGAYFNKEAGNTVKFFAAGKEIANKYMYNASATPKVENVLLKAGDTIAVQRDSKAAGVDYALIIKTAEIPTANATLVEDFTTVGDKASVWNATVTGTDDKATYTQVEATATDINGASGSGVANLTTEITGKGSAIIYVVIPKVSTDIQADSVTVTLK